MSFNSPLPGIILLFIALAIGKVSFGQLNCALNNYEDILYEVEKTHTIKYGENYTLSGKAVDLMMDVYQPVGDTSIFRPGIIMAFGGSFVGGNKEDVQDLCISLSARGYVSFAIDYRLFDLVTIPDSTLILRTMLDARSDMLGAVKYLQHDIQNGNTFRISAESLFIGGVSAGAITALHAALLQPGDPVIDWMVPVLEEAGGYEGNSNLPEAMDAPIQIAGVFNLLGAVCDPGWIDVNDVPVVSMHGTADDVVPYDKGIIYLDLGPISIPLITLFGSHVIHEKLLEANIQNQLITVPGGQHGDFLIDGSIWSDSLSNTVFSSFYDWILCPEPSNNLDEMRYHSIAVFPVPTIGRLNVQLPADQKELHYEIWALSGKRLKYGIINQAHAYMDVSELPAGLYLLNAYNPTGKDIYQQKFSVVR